MSWYTIASTIAIPFVVALLKKIKLPSKWAPLAAFAVAGILVGIGKVFGVEQNVNDIAQAIGKDVGTVQVTLNRMKGKKIYNMADHTWGLAAPRTT